MPSFEVDNIPQDINKILSETNKYEQIETKIINHILTTSNIIPLLKKKCQEILLNDETQSIEQVIKILSIESTDDIIRLDPTANEQQVREKLRELTVKELQEIIY